MSHRRNTRARKARARLPHARSAPRQRPQRGPHRALVIATLLVFACIPAVGAVDRGVQPVERPARGAPPKRPTPTNPANPANPTTPAQPAAPTTTPAPNAPTKPKPAPGVGPYITRNNRKDLAFNVLVRVRSDSPRDVIRYRDPFDGRTVDMPRITPFRFETLSMVFPVVPMTASSQAFEGDVSGVLRLNDDKPAGAQEPTLLTGYPGVLLARWDAVAPKGQTLECRQVTLTARVPMRCWNVVFDEKAAAAVPWPKEWAPAAAEFLKPQLFMETGVDASGQVRPFDPKPVADALARMLRAEGITSPQAAPPVVLAKAVAAQVWQGVAVSGEGLTSAATGEMSGVSLQPPARTLELRRGSEHDAAVLLAALLKQAGLPARTVIGFDVSGDSDAFLSTGQKNRLRSWVEFALYDERENTLNWVPVDIASLRKSSSRPPRDRARPWRFFGTHDELNAVTPFALQFHPPTDVVSYGYPGFWGWFITPQPPPSAMPTLLFSAAPMSVRGGEPPREPPQRK